MQPTWSETRTLAGFRETESVTAETALTCRYVTRRERVHASGTVKRAEKQRVQKRVIVLAKLNHEARKYSARMSLVAMVLRTLRP